jgi:Na+-translocating ferredoxin:NAD+ oxidoreductase subunit G
MNGQSLNHWGKSKKKRNQKINFSFRKGRFKMTDNQLTDSGNTDRFQNSYILQAWLVLTLALVFGISLSAVQIKLGPRIAANKINETLAKIPEVVLGKDKAGKLAETGKTLSVKPHTIEVEKNGKKKYYTAYEAKYPDGISAGWVTKAGGQGYADKIELLLGLDPEAVKITGLFVLDQKETPGLGNKIIEEKWRSQFYGKSTGIALKVVKGGAGKANEIDAITGATISSKSVCSIINKTVYDLKGQLALKAAQHKKGK